MTFHAQWTLSVQSGLDHQHDFLNTELYPKRRRIQGKSGEQASESLGLQQDLILPKSATGKPHRTPLVTLQVAYDVQTTQ